MSKIDIKIDKRTELIYIIGLLADYHLCTKENFQYKVEILKHFNKQLDHPAIKYFQYLVKEGFDYDAIATFAIHLNEKTFEVEYQFSDYLIQRAGHGNGKIGLDKLNEFVRLIRHFSIESEFQKFFESNLSFYQEAIKPLEEIKKYNIVELIEKFFGWKQKSYNYILCPTLFLSGFGPLIQDNDEQHVFAIIGCYAIKDTVPIFITNNNILGALSHLIHEFSHSFVNPTTTLFYKDFLKYQKFSKYLDTNNMYMTYKGHLETIINEYLVRVVTNILIRNIIGIEKCKIEEIFKFDKMHGFEYIEDFFNLVDEKYFKNRDSYKNFKDFYPEIINFAEEIENKL